MPADHYGDFPLYSVGVDSFNNIWCGHAFGVHKYDGEQWTTFDVLNDANQNTYDIETDCDGNVWFAGYAFGIYKYDGENWFHYNYNNSGLSFNTVRAIAIDKNEFWFGTQGGGVSKLTVSQGAPVMALADNSVKRSSVFQNYPNPFNSQTVLKYALPEACHVSLKIYNMLGEEVRVLANGPQGEGYKSVLWDGRDNSGELVSSGAYICKLVAGTFTQSGTMMFIK